jgi:DNA-binding CsgD family transcriptional regulator
LAVWQQLSRGEWVILDCLDAVSGLRLVLLRLKSRAATRPWHRLSERENAVVSAIAAGRSNREIASALGVSVSTVAGHLRSARRKLGGARRLDVVLEWREGGRQREPTR